MRRGFTLIELLLALGAFASVGLALGSALRAGYQAWRAADERGQLVQEARRTLEDLGVELRNVRDVPGLSFEGGPDRLAFDTRVGGEAPGLVRVVYQAVPQSRAILKTRLSLDGEPSDRRLCASPSTVAFAYAYRDPDLVDSTLWMDVWDEKKGRPGGVRVRLTLADRSGLLHSFVKTVRLPGGVVP